MTAQTRLLIADDSPQVRQELRLLLPLAGPIEVVGEAADGLAAVAQAEALRPDVVLLDLAMPGLDGCVARRLISARGLAQRVVILTLYAGAANRHAAQAAGAAAFVVKGANLDALLAAILGEDSGPGSGNGE